MPQPVHTCVTSLQARWYMGVRAYMQILISFGVLCSSRGAGLKVAGFRHRWYEAEDWWYDAEEEKWRKGSWRKGRWRGWTGEWQTFWRNGELWVKVTHPGFWRPPYRGAKPIWKKFRFKSLEMVPTKQWTPMIASSWQEDKIWNSSDANRLHDCIAKTGFVHFAPHTSLMVVPAGVPAWVPAYKEWCIVPAEAAHWLDRIVKTADSIITVSPQGDGEDWTLTHGGRVSSKMQEDQEDFGWQIAK